jgi:electron transport complex protein RnfE
MSGVNIKDIIVNGVWKQNAGIVQILGICPVLAISTTVVNGVSLGLATALVMLCSGMAVALVRHLIPNELRNPIFILIIAAVVTILDLTMNAYLHELYVVLGIFIPLIVTNCIVLARAEAFAAKNGIVHSGLDGFIMGIGLTLVLGILGGMRELIGKGTLLSGIELVFGQSAKVWTLYIVPIDYHYQFLLAILPPGAFLGLALLIAGRAWLNMRVETKAQQIPIGLSNISASNSRT